MQRLLVLGSANADQVVDIDRLPLTGETIAGRNPAVIPGGKGANQAVAAARLGCATTFVAQVGDDSLGEMLRNAINSAGADASAMRTVSEPTGQALVFRLADGDNAIIIIGGANRAWQDIPSDFTARLPGAGVLLLQREVPDAVNIAAAQAAKAAGVLVLLDAGGDDTPVPEHLLRAVNIFSPNESELARLTGLPTADEPQVIAAARHLQAQGFADIVVKRGAQGCLWLPVTGPLLRHAAFSVPVMDTTGAGDCFTAAVAVGLIRREPWPTILRGACAAAAMCVQSKGAASAMPTHAQVQEFLAQADKPGFCK